MPPSSKRRKVDVDHAAALCQQCRTPCSAAEVANDDNYDESGALFCTPCWEKDEGEAVIATIPTEPASPEALRAVVRDDDLPKDQAWWRCKGCGAFVYSQAHASSCPHRAVWATAAQESGDTKWQAAFDANPAVPASQRGLMTISCASCEATFDFTPNEQVFYARRAFTPPARCQACRASKKDARAAAMHKAGAAILAEEAAAAAARKEKAGKVQALDQVERGSSEEVGVPAGWTKATDPASGRTYFFHAASKTTQWEAPTDAVGVAAAASLGDGATRAEDEALAARDGGYAGPEAGTIGPPLKIGCMDCNKSFLFTWKERCFYRSRDLSQPKRCKPCRVAKREARSRNPSFLNNGKQRTGRGGRDEEVVNLGQLRRGGRGVQRDDAMDAERALRKRDAQEMARLATEW